MWMHLLPELILSIGATIVLLISCGGNQPQMRDLLRWFSFATILGTITSVIYQSDSTVRIIENWTTISPLTTAFTVTLLGLTGWTILMAKTPERNPGEWFSLILFTGLGSMVLARTANLAGLFLGIEILSIALYILVAFLYEKKINLRGGAIYLVLASFASAFLGFGMSLIYAVYGTINIAEISHLAITGGKMPVLATLGFGIFLVGVGFKLAVVPFHMWAADVYEAAPGAISGIIASTSKGATIAAFLPFSFLLTTHHAVLVFFSGASMLIGNLLGLRETRVKRILAYSSVAHVGYLLLAFLAVDSKVAMGGMNSTNAILFYVAAYGLSVLGAFVVISILRPEGAVTLTDLHGTARRNPILATCLLIFTVSLAGLPISMGFWGKLYLFSIAFKAGYMKLAILGLIASAIGIFYYFRIIMHTFMVSPEMNPRGVAAPTGSFEKAMVVATAFAVVIFSIFPDWFLSLIKLKF